MSDYLYGKLNSETIIEKYEGGVSDTVKVSIDSKNKIEAEVLKTPKILTIIKNSESGNEIEYKFDGSADINIDLHEVDVYSGKSTNETASVIVNKEENSIDVQVLKTPGTLTITKSEEELSFNGSENLSIDIPEYIGVENDTANIYIDSNNIEVNVKALPTDNSVITGQNIVDSFGDLNNYITTVFDDLRSQISPIQEDISNIEENINQLEATTSILTTIGDGDKYLSDDGQYKEISGFELSDLPPFTNKFSINMSNYGATNLNGVLTVPIVESSNFSVDWGDNSDLSIYTNATTSITHTYADPAFQGWVTIYGDWGGIKFSSSSNDNKRAIVDIEYDRNITSVPEYGLYGCTSLKSFKVADNFYLLYKYALYNTSSLEAISWPEGCVYFREYSMQRSYLKGPLLIDINSNVAGSSYAFSYCGKLTSVIFLENNFSGVQISSYMFQNCTKLREVELCRNIERINTGAFSSCNQLTELTIPEDGYYTPTLTIDSQAIPNVKKLIIKKKSSLVVLSNINALTNAELIFVPSTLLGDYKTATNWLNFADKIYPIDGNYSETITIPVAAWENGASAVIVQVAGSTSEERNIIEFMLVDADGKQIEDIYGLSATQGTTQMTFTCQTKPAQDIHIFIKSTLTNY